MGLTKRQEQMITEMVIAESRATYESQQERHRILEGLDEEDILEEAPKPAGLPLALRHAITDLVEAFVAGNQLYEGRDLDDGRAAKRAASYLQHLLEEDVAETVSMLQGGDFDDFGGSSMEDEMDQHMLPMHPRGSGKPGGVTGGSGHVEIGEPEPHAHMDRPEPSRGYGGAGEEPGELPPMHPRGRR